MRSRITAIAVVGLMFGLGACSSGGSTSTAPTTDRTVIITTTTGSTLPPRELAAALAKFFATNGGKDLLTFEKLTVEVSKGTTMKRPQCLPIEAALGKVGSPDYFIFQAGQIRDPVLGKKWHDDVAVKRLYLAACGSGTALPANAGPKVKAYTDDLRSAMAEHGYTI